MQPFEDRLRRDADGIEVTVGDEFAPRVVGRARRLRRRRRAGLTGAFVGVLGAALVGAFLVLPNRQPRHTVAVIQQGKLPATAHPVTATVTSRNGVTVALTLDMTTVVPGEAITGQLRITNPTGHRTTVPYGCPAEVYQVVLSDKYMSPKIGDQDVGCRPSFTVAPGRNLYPVVVDTDAAAPGAYAAKLSVAGPRIPIPPAIRVRILAGPSTPAGIVRSACVGVGELFSLHASATAVEFQIEGYQRQISALTRRHPSYRALASAISALDNRISRAVPQLRYVTSARLPSPHAVESACARLAGRTGAADTPATTKGP
jgi:hypothetical protein